MCGETVTVNLRAFMFLYPPGGYVVDVSVCLFVFVIIPNVVNGSL